MKTYWLIRAIGCKKKRIVDQRHSNRNYSNESKRGGGGGDGREKPKTYFKKQWPKPIFEVHLNYKAHI